MEKLVLSQAEAEEIMAKYLEKIIDLVDGEIVKNKNKFHLIDYVNYRDEKLMRFRNMKERAFIDILRLALIDVGYPIKFIKETNRDNVIKYEGFYEIVSKRGR